MQSRKSHSQGHHSGQNYNGQHGHQQNFTRGLTHQSFLFTVTYLSCDQSEQSAKFPKSTFYG